MFFDEDRRDDVYPQIMLSIARTQRELLNCRFRWTDKLPVPQKSGFWKKKRNPRYDSLLIRLEDEKRRAKDHRTAMGYGSGVFWWTLPWTQVEDYLIYDLMQEDEVGNWRFQRTWETRQTQRGILLLLREEGHYSNFSQSTSYETGILSSYSESEINEKMRDYTRMMNRWDLATLALDGDHPVKSYLSGIEYASGADYLLSAEHFYLRDHYQTQYARSLYTETETTTLTVSSHSRHYCALYAVGEIEIAGTGVRSLTIHNYALCSSNGDMPEEIRTLYESKDAAVGCAAFLADFADVDSVPLELFGGGLHTGTVSFQDAVRQAEIYTCLADKIIL